MTYIPKELNSYANTFTTSQLCHYLEKPLQLCT